MANLKNINFMSKAQFDELSTLNDNELYAVNTPAVVDSYSDDSGNWYRIYSDGWCEQGGKSSSVTVNLLKPFANTEYTLLKSVVYNNTGNAPYNVLGATSSKTETSFTWTGGTTVNYWVAYGQGAE